MQPNWSPPCEESTGKVVRVIDIETTGTDPVADAVIEIASVDVLSDGTIANRQSMVVRPGMPIPPEASAVHHLIDDDLADTPPLMNAIHLFRGADAYVAHNADFEQSFLGPLLGEATSARTSARCASGRTCRRTTTRRSGIGSAS